ncbi:hypothetical protein [Carboxylicivirga sp. N1Y90]|uniref:hypothetical protein n=1 Tax=Carboxylicivirga fragile TaxID=3417571 RepID=UPI003D34B1D1|nr:hypothetical protein [Marinilabiliaceae bacterium N1Y90]
MGKENKNFNSKLKGLISDPVFSKIISALIALIAGVLVNFIVTFFNDKPEKPANLIENKIEELNSISDNLLKLKDFIEEQKDIIIAQEELIISLRQKNEELDPIVNSKQETVNAIMWEAEKRAERNVWKERLIGIAIGVLGSLIATWIWTKFVRKTTANNV